MIILHGFYDNGKIQISEKDLPQMKAKIKVIIDDVDNQKLEDNPARGMWKDRPEMSDPVNYINELRKRSGRRYGS